MNALYLHINRLHIHAGLYDAVTYSLTEGVEHKKVQIH